MLIFQFLNFSISQFLNTWFHGSTLLVPIAHRSTVDLVATTQYIIAFSLKHICKEFNIYGCSLRFTPGNWYFEHSLDAVFDSIETTY